MMSFLTELRERNESLFFFGGVCFIAGIAFLILSRIYPLSVAGANAWYKPFKFAFSIGMYSWTMAWYVYYLPSTFRVTYFNVAVIILLGFEIVYIALQAGRGQLSHFNVSSPGYNILYQLMALTATGISLYTAYITWVFFQNTFPELPDYYVWAIRCALLLFVVFSLEGFLMGSRMSHTIGSADGGPGLPLLGWSTRYGDPRVAHFIGMHALQVLPLLSFYLIKNTRLTLIAGLVYFLLACWVLIQALQGRPFIKN